jgi:NitT/TauT family transport system substrate-binding protein
MTMDDIKQSTVTPPYENYLLLGRVDAVPGYIDAEVPELEAKAGGPGSLSIMQGSDFGYAVYGSGLFTSEKMIAEKSDLVQRFVNAYMQAFADVIKSPQEAADIIIEANPEYGPKKDVLVKQIEADVKGTFFSADTKASGIGWMTKDAWEKTTKILLDQGAMKQAINVEAAFTDKYLKGANALKR